MIIQRQITNKIIDNLFKGKVIVVYGPRQAGKTTLVKEILKKFPENSRYYNCDFLDIQETFSYKNISKIGDLLKNIKILVLDEAQRIENIGMVLKILADNYKDTQVIATGSSSFELSNKINEPLTGRKIDFLLLPFSIKEVSSDIIETQRNTDKFLRFGGYPEQFLKEEDQKVIYLKELTNSYLFKDIFTFQDIRKPEVLSNLLKLLAFQIGQEVSFTELAQKLGIDQTVVQRYIYFLEQAFVVFRLPAFGKNLRNEVLKSRKIYFYDIGVRNTLIQNYNTLDLRNDIGFLWENFCIIERLKELNYRQDYRNKYFWRTYDQKEIDYLEEKGENLYAFEFKWSEEKKGVLPKQFLEAYKGSSFEVINKDNFLNFLNF